MGPFKVGDDCRIAAGAVVLNEIPPSSTAVGVPAKVVRRFGMKVGDLDQVHMPDPVETELEELRKRVEKLENFTKER